MDVTRRLKATSEEAMAGLPWPSISPQKIASGDEIIYDNLKATYDQLCIGKRMSLAESNHSSAARNEAQES